MGDDSFTIHICPPAYPEGFEPFLCAHPLPMQLCDARVRWKPNGGGAIAVDHARCLACGATVGTGIKRNIFVDIQCLLALEICAAAPFQMRLFAMQEVYLQRAAVLFGEDGWLGDEAWRELAELIDPNLTMRVIDAGANGDGTRFFRVFTDEEYWPEAATEQAQGKLDL